MSHDLYESITAKVIEMLEGGVAPWRSPILGQSKAGWPKNLTTGREYRGVNVFLLAFAAWTQGYSSSHWLTFRQAKERGGHVKKGEKSSMVVFWKQYATTDRETGEAINVPVLRHYLVFNAEQCEGIAIPDAPSFVPSSFEPVYEAERIVRTYQDAPVIEHGGSKAYYLPKPDRVHVPEPTRFETAEAYYATLFHELAHSTAHSSRLDRGIDRDPAPFGSPDYGKEELVAEMTAAFLCGRCGILPSTIESSAAYLDGWLRAIKSDKRLIVTAAGAAQRAADWIRGIRPGVTVDAGDHPSDQAAEEAPMQTAEPTTKDALGPTEAAAA